MYFHFLNQIDIGNNNHFNKFPPNIFPIKLNEAESGLKKLLPCFLEQTSFQLTIKIEGEKETRNHIVILHILWWKNLYLKKSIIAPGLPDHLKKKTWITSFLSICKNNFFIVLNKCYVIFSVAMKLQLMIILMRYHFCKTHFNTTVLSITRNPVEGR